MLHGNVGRKRPDLSERNVANSVHGKTRTPEHISYSAMVQRCTDKNHKDYKNYGGRGITVCSRWLEKNGIGFLNFLQDMGEKPRDSHINRQDNDRHYAPDNCEWSTPKTNARNRRSNKLIKFKGVSKCIAQWAEDLGIERKTLQMRLKVWTVEKAFTTPYNPRKEK